MPTSRREDYQNRMDEQLALWSARFEALKAEAGTGAKPDIAQKLERWRQAKALATAKLDELKRTATDDWDARKVELERAWHDVEMLLDEGVPVAHAHLFTKAEIESLTAEQTDAILEAMAIAVVADGKIGPDEVARFNRELDRVPWTQPTEAIINKAQAAQERVLALANDDERRAMLTSIAARVPRGTIAEKTLGMMALVMTAGSPVNVDEQTTLTAFALAFGIDKERLAVVASSLRGA